jgi:hypothetical protein
LEWESARAISFNAEKCVANALEHFRHAGKIRAIAIAAERLSSVSSFDVIRLQILRDPIQQLQSFAYIGPITAFHIAKNMGFPVAKPDRHLERLARSNGFDSVKEFCGTIATYLGEDIRLVDSVLWTPYCGVLRLCTTITSSVFPFCGDSRLRFFLRS